MKIGFFDSGIGGLTVLSEAIKRLPNHEYLYYADTLHAPYGPKPKEEVRGYVFEAIEFLVQQGAQIIVIACNTATSIAIEELRTKYSIPIIGMEPAVKPAIHLKDEMKKRVLVTATPLTLKEEKLHRLIQQLDAEHITDLLPLPGLVRFAEAFDFSDTTVIPYLREQLAFFNVKEYKAVVLGCTHFPFFSKQFKQLFPEGITLIDGSVGTVTHLEKMIVKMQNDTQNELKVTFFKSGCLVTDEVELKNFTRLIDRLMK